jgi:predicted HTH domain antitoxin
VSKLVIDVAENSLEQLGWTAAQAEQELRLRLAVELFRTGKYSAGGAAEAAGVPVTVFNSRRAEFGLYAFDYSPDELEREVELLKGLSEKD